MAISLLPGEAAKKRTEKKVRRFSFLGALALLLGVAAVSAGVFIFKSVLAGEIKNLETEIEREKEKISAEADLEIKAQTLGEKVATLEKILAGATHYSILLDNLTEITPSEISFSTLAATSAEKASLSGTATSYVGLAKFIRALNDPEGGGKLFSETELRSVSLDAQTGQVKFSLELAVKKGVL